MRPFHLDSAWAKLKRANDHKSTLLEAIDAYSGSQQGAVGRHIECMTDNLIFKLDRPLEKLPVDIAMMIGDALFNYRSALDHLMQALIVQSGSEPNSRTQFPIFEKSERFLSDGKHQMRGTLPVIAAIVELQQKFHNIYPASGDRLWKLHRLHNLDKHQCLHHLSVVCAGVFASVDSSQLAQLGLEADRDPDVDFIAPDHQLRTGVTLATFPGTYKMIPFTVSFEPSFAAGDIASGEMVREVVGGIGDTVNNIIDQFTRLFFDFDSSALGRLYRPFHKQIDVIQGILGVEREGK